MPQLLRATIILTIPVLQARMFSYPDAQRYRLGVNYQQLPVNSARAPVHCPFERSGAMNFGSNYGDEPNYVGSSLQPNTFAKASNGAGPVSSTITEHEEWIGKVCSYASGVEDKDYEQAAGLWKVLGREEGHQARFVGNVASNVRQIKHAQLRKRVYGRCFLVCREIG